MKELYMKRKKLSDEEYSKYYKEGLHECECSEPGYCPILQLTMTKPLHDRCKSNQGNRDYLIETAQKLSKRRDLQDEKYLKKKELDKKANSVDQAILALQHNGVDLSDKPSEGLGDTVTKILGKFGITKKIVSEVAGVDCKCDKRKAWLNKIFPYGVKDE
tara:strand:+ start:2966 stop:3445 length:480 start_codon:yes stop_codon:yes gene_type:complete